MIPEPKRIIFIPFIDAFGGAERLVLDLSRFLHERGTPHVLACFSQSIGLQAYADWPLEIHQILPKRNPFFEARSLRAFLRSATQPGGFHPLLFDLKSAFYSGIAAANTFYLHLTDPPSLLPADASKYSSSARRDYEEFANVASNGTTQALRGELAHRLNRRGVRRAKKVIVMTERIRKELHQLYGVDSLVIRPGVSANPLPRVPSSEIQIPLRLLSVSRLEANKRVDWILRALKTLQSEGLLKKSDWVFEVVGHGPAADSLKELSKQLGLTQQVFFLGHVSDDDLAAAYARANLFVMPAVQGYGLPALEALSRGIATIVHGESGVSEILNQTPWVKIVEGDNGSLASAIGSMKTRLATGQLSNANMVEIPTASGWASEICTACRWLAR